MHFDEAGFCRVSAPAKINLFLHVTGRRPDGYHTLQTAFRMIERGDVLYLRVRADGEIHRVNDVPGVPAEQDLVIRAARLLKERTGCALGADIRVEKNLPMGGGLGGGSSDAASTLLALNRLWQTDVPRATLQAWALTLGADVPFFVFGRTAIAEGVGEELRPLALPPAWYVVVEPPVSVPTPQIFRDEGLTRDTEAVIISASSVGEHLSSGVSRKQEKPKHQAIQETHDTTHVEQAEAVARIIAQQTRNDLQPVACRLFPEVQQALDALHPFGRADAMPSMSGSGACVFLPCATRDSAEEVVEELSRQWRVWSAASLDVHPLHDWAD